MEKDLKKIYIIVPTHGAGDAFIECINSLVSQTYKPTEVIIVDNNVKDGSITKLKQGWKLQTTEKENFEYATYQNIGITIYKLQSNTGVTGGRNAGISLLPQEYDYACFVDHDMIAEKELLENLVTTAAKDSSIGIVTPKIFYWENKKFIWSAGTDINLKTGQTIFYGGEDHGQYEEEKQVAVAPAILLVKKQVIDIVPHFDERYFATYEDTDFCFAARIAGFKTYYCPTAIAYHKIPYDPQTAMRRLLDRAYWVGRNRYLFLRKFHYFSVLTILFIPIYALYYGKIALQYKNISAISQYCKGVYNGVTEKI